MAKRIVICTDGTWNKPEQTDQGTACSTNVVKIVAAVRPQDSKGMTQVVYYHKGVGERGGLWQTGNDQSIGQRRAPPVHGCAHDTGPGL